MHVHASTPMRRLVGKWVLQRKQLPNLPCKILLGFLRTSNQNGATARLHAESIGKKNHSIVAPFTFAFTKKTQKKEKRRVIVLDRRTLYWHSTAWNQEKASKKLSGPVDCNKSKGGGVIKIKALDLAD